MRTLFSIRLLCITIALLGSAGIAGAQVSVGVV
jgi:hypothetical protein